MIDIPGMGFNSRNEKINSFNTFEEFMDYFILSINLFVEKMELKKFHLGGHSIGAYISMYYFE